MDRKESLRQIAAKCAELLITNYKIKRIILIGSLTTGTIHKKSDIDLAVEGLPSRDYIRSLTELYDILPPGVELNLIPIEDAFETLKQKILQNGEVIYECRI